MTRPQKQMWNTYHILHNEYLTALVCNVQIRTVRRLLEAEYSRRGGRYVPEAAPPISNVCPCAGACWRCPLTDCQLPTDAPTSINYDGHCFDWLM